MSVVGAVLILRDYSIFDGLRRSRWIGHYSAGVSVLRRAFWCDAGDHYLDPGRVYAGSGAWPFALAAALMPPVVFLVALYRLSPQENSADVF